MDGSHGPEWAAMSVLWKPHTYIPSATVGVGTIRHAMPQVSWQRMHVCMCVCMYVLMKDVFNVSQEKMLTPFFQWIT